MLRSVLTCCLLSTALGAVSVCLIELSRVLQGLGEVASTNRSDYGQMAAASGKNINDLGLYHDCNKVDIAKYVYFELSKLPMIGMGLCGPKLCAKSDYEAIIAFLLNPSATLDADFPENLRELPVFREIRSRRRLQTIEISVASISLHFSRDEAEDKWGTYDGGFYSMLIICFFIVVLCCVATAVDLQKQRAEVIRRANQEILEMASVDESKVNGSFLSSSESSELTEVAVQAAPKPSKAVQVLLCFSVYTNLRKLFRAKPAEDKNSLDVFNGMKVLSIGWVVLGHCFLFRITETVVLNIDEVPERVSYWYAALVYGGLFSVDAFFWMSGVLFAYLAIGQFRSTRGVSWSVLYLHRFIRILPLYMFILFMSWSFSAYIGGGPMWYTFDEVQEDCTKYWWTMPLFINNLYMPNNDGAACLTGSWYLANDMQFFLISPPIIYLYVKESRWIGWLLTSFLTCVCVLFSGVIAWDLDLNVVPASSQDRYYMADYYYKPYTRIGPYALGLMCGFIYYSWTKKVEKQAPFDSCAYAAATYINESRVVRWLCYFFGLFIINLMVFVPYDQYNDVSWTKWTRGGNAAYLSFNHSLFALGLSLFFLPILLGHNRILASFLSADVWTPIARLVFGIFLLHMVVGHIILKSQPASNFLEPVAVFTDAVSFFIFALVLAIPVAIITESPIPGLERILLGRGKK